MKNILVSGASGYIGSWLVKKLREENIGVGVLLRENNKELQSYFSGTEIIQHDITSNVIPVINGRYDLFFHLAAANDIDSSDTQNALLTTSFGAHQCLKLCKHYGIRNFIYVSTFQVYGKAEGELSESTEVAPINDYAITHLFAEEYVKMFHRTKGINFLILRPTNIYGAPLNKKIDRWSLVPSCFCLEVFESQTITLKSSGKQSRDFMDLSDLVNTFSIFCNQFDEYKNSVVNVSSGNTFSILDMAKAVKEQYEIRYNKNADLVIESDEPKDSNKFKIDRKKISSTGYSFQSPSSLTEQINAIFTVLEN